MWNVSDDGRDFQLGSDGAGIEARRSRLDEHAINAQPVLMRQSGQRLNSSFRVHCSFHVSTILEI